MRRPQTRPRASTSAKADRQPTPAPNRAIDMSVLSDAIGYRLRRAQLAVFQDLIDSFAAYDIRPAQFSVLVLVERNPGLNQSEIASALGIKRTNFVALVDALEKRGLAQRLPTATDRRSNALHLTDAGQKLIATLRQIQSDHEARLIARIGEPGRRQLLDLLADLADIAGDQLIEDE